MASIKLEPLPDNNFDHVEIIKKECSINSHVEDSTDSGDYTIQTRIVEQIPKRERHDDVRKVSYSNRMQHYREAWERNPAFSAWLTRGRNSRKARCMVCKSEMTADVSVLKYHSRSNKHLRKLVSIEPSNITLISKGATDSVHGKHEVFKKGVYNPSWEADPRFASWIQRGSTITLAHCHLCNTDIAADVGTLRRHLATYGHMRAAEFDNQVRVLSSKVVEEDSINIQSSADDDTVLVHEIIHRDEGDVDVVGPTEMRQGQTTLVRDDRGDPRERLTFIIGKFLLKGYKMLNATCQKCGCVLLRDHKGTSHCFGCQYGLMEEINSGRGGAAAKSRPRVPRTLATDWQHHERRSHSRSPIKLTNIDGAIDEIFIKEEEEEVTEIVINEDSSANVFVGEALHDEDEDSTQTEKYGEAALRGEVAALVLALRRRLAALTSQLRRGHDMDNCLDGLDTTITALARLRQL